MTDHVIQQLTQENESLRRMLAQYQDLDLLDPQYPDGKLSDDDDGELSIAIAPDHEHGLVRLSFGKPVAWTAMPPQQAVELAEILITNARKVSTEPIVVRLNMKEQS